MTLTRDDGGVAASPGDPAHLSPSDPWREHVQSNRTPQPPAALLLRLRLAFDPTELSIALSIAPTGYLVAAMSAMDVAKLRYDQKILDDFIDGRWYRQNVLVGMSQREKAELARWPPHGDRDEWVRNGPPTGATDG